jgi:hypothetical protein
MIILPASCWRFFQTVDLVELQKDGKKIGEKIK